MDALTCLHETVTKAYGVSDVISDIAYRISSNIYVFEKEESYDL